VDAAGERRCRDIIDGGGALRHPRPGRLAVLAVVVLVAAFVQGAGGFGFALVAAPVVGLVDAALLVLSG
jgi:hypothetical protein